MSVYRCFMDDMDEHMKSSHASLDSFVQILRRPQYLRHLLTLNERPQIDKLI